MSLHALLLLVWPPTVQARLVQLERAGHRSPTLWQIELGVLRMWHRAMFRSETIGQCTAHPVRSTWRARLLAWRPLRFPFLMAERAIAPWDMSGLLSGRERIIRHLLAAHHDGLQFLYDLQMLQIHPGAMDELQRRLEAVLDGSDPRAEWLRDLCVYQGYHEDLHTGLLAFRAGTLPDDPDPDVSFDAYLRWCAAQPATPGRSWRLLWSRS